MATSNKAFDYVRNVSALLGLGNIVAAYWDRASAGHRSMQDFLQQDAVRLRLWISCVVLGLFGLVTLGLLIKQRSDIIADYEENSGKQQIIALSFGAGLTIIAVALSLLLTIVRP